MSYQASNADDVAMAVEGQKDVGFTLINGIAVAALYAVLGMAGLTS